MDNLDSNEINNEIYIGVEENNHVELKEEDATISQGFDVQILESSLKEKLAKLPTENCKIYEVSEKFKDLQKESYVPLVVSIGPLHHGESHLQAMESFKLRCLNKLMNEHNISLKELSEYATAMESRVRACYQNLKCTQDISEMILLDGIFIILLIATDYERLAQVDFHVKSDPDSSIEKDIMHDMLLLENQLPLFFVMGLLEILDPKHKCSESFPRDLVKYFREVGITDRLKMDYEYQAWHLVDFLLMLHLPPNTRQLKLPTAIRSVCTRNAHSSECTTTCRSASELQEAGVHFYPDTSAGLFEIFFDEYVGLLCLPQLTVNYTTETFFRNLIAFEQSAYQNQITSYIIVMDSLINTAEDVKLLVKNRIIVNSLGDNDQLVADLFNNLCKGVTEKSDFIFATLCSDLNGYSQSYYDGWMYTFSKWKKRWSEWKSMLISKYFSNPWSAIGFLAATIVVVLTIVQTVCAILALQHN